MVVIFQGSGGIAPMSPKYRFQSSGPKVSGGIFMSCKVMERLVLRLGVLVWEVLEEL
jgi:hypothetical protein